jgi:hypothetical protein
MHKSANLNISDGKPMIFQGFIVPCCLSESPVIACCQLLSAYYTSIPINCISLLALKLWQMPA